jgi:hypothetical protein
MDTYPTLNYPTIGSLEVFAALAVACAVALVRLRRIGRHPGPLPGSPDRTPLERAREAAEALSPYERERFRRWFEGRWPAGRGDGHDEGITT